MGNKRWLLVLVGLMVFVLFGMNRECWAEDDLRADLKQAQLEIQQLRTELTELKKSSSWQYRAELEQAVSQVPAMAKDEAASGGLDLPAGWSIKPYGYFKFDMIYDDSAMVNGNFIKWVSSEENRNRADDKFTVTARQTRLGTKVFAPNIGDAKVMGRIEVDFYNPATSATNEYKSTPMMRHAYGQMTGNDWSILFGQTSDIISPLFPNTLNYTVGWWSGNMGYRHPQLALSKWWECPEGCQFKVETAVSREIGDDNQSFTDFDDDGIDDTNSSGVDDGQDNGTPTVLGRLSCSIPMGGKKLVTGVSGHFGKEEVDWHEDGLGTAGDDDSVHTWSLNTDLLVPVTDQIEFKGEVFWGENVNSYLGGIGQGINSGTRSEIEAMGAWAQLKYQPTTEWAFHTGAGIDDPLSADLPSGARDENFFAFANANYFFSKYLLTGLELTYVRTDYKESDDGDDFRIQNSWILKF